jgi:hypothetical protein
VVIPRCIGFRYGNGKVSGEDKEDAIWSSRAPAERAGGDPPMPTGVVATPSSPFLYCCPKEMIFLLCISSRTNKHYQHAAVEKWAGWAGRAGRVASAADRGWRNVLDRLVQSPMASACSPRTSVCMVTAGAGA